MSLNYFYSENLGKPVSCSGSVSAAGVAGSADVDTSKPVSVVLSCFLLPESGRVCKLHSIRPHVFVAPLSLCVFARCALLVIFCKAVLSIPNQIQCNSFKRQGFFLSSCMGSRLLCRLL